jgi:Cys-tRNA(Pro)/Cys-tRNA(Cys) deacylase
VSEIKTNPMRHLDKLGIPYKVHLFNPDDVSTGTEIADLLGEDHTRVFKTLVTIAKSKKHYVFVIPVDLELDLKKAAASVGEKSVEMIHVKDITKVTGHVRGGCSPLGMKKQYVTTFHQTARDIDTIMVSAGRIGYQIALAPSDLVALAGGQYADIVRE